MIILKSLAIIILTPIVGGLLTGLDRIISARMQARKGPPLLQPFYDVIKLFQKETIEVNTMHRFFVYLSMVFAMLTALIIALGGDILLAVFSLTLASSLFVLGGYASNSPYSVIGAERELLQIMSYEPMIMIISVGFYYVNKSFFINTIISGNTPAIVLLPGLFLGLLYVLTIKLRKSPFDLSMSHHGHQEIVKGITTEYSGTDLAIIEITHWIEVIISLSFVYLFFVYSNPFSPIFAVIACAVVYFLEILIDNSFARAKWQFTLKSSWIVTVCLGFANFIVLSFIK